VRAGAYGGHSSIIEIVKTNIVELETLCPWSNDTMGIALTIFESEFFSKF